MDANKYLKLNSYVLLFLILIPKSSLYTVAYENENLKRYEIRLGKHKLYVTIARKDEEHRKGLMYRKKLRDNEGMLFIYKTSKYQSFWMKNTYIPLDIGFFDKNRRLLEKRTMPKPKSSRIITSQYIAKYVLEVNKGWFSQNRIKIGTKLHLPPNLK